MTRIKDGVAVVTGGASGIGAALATELATRGAAVVIADIDAEGLERVSRDLQAAGADCLSRVVDVADRTAVDALVADVEAHYGRASILVNNAGVTLFGTAEDTTAADLEWLMGVNFRGVVNGCSAFLPLLHKEDSAHIVNLSSLFGLISVPLQSAYNASKFAVRGYTDAMRMELEDTTIGVTCVHPGGVLTPIARRGRVSDGVAKERFNRLVNTFESRAMTTPEQAARQIADAIEKNRKRLLIGADARIIDKLARLFPTAYDRLLGLKKLTSRA